MTYLHKKIKNLFDENSYIDIDQSERTTLTFVMLVLAITSTLMSILNIISMKGTSILIASSAIAILSCVFFILFINIKDMNSKIYKISKLLCLTLIEILIIYFLISGAPEGFGIIWSLIVPVSAAFFLNKKTSIIFTLIVFMTIVFLFWTPIGRNLLLYDYTDSYLLKFPFAYFSFFLIGGSIEKIRNKTYQNLISLKEKYEDLAKYDSLTKLYNRQFFEEHMLNLSYPSALLMFDLDHFKVVNDTFGHMCGDTVLQQFSNQLKTKFLIYGDSFRWGGEEFIVLINNVKDIKKIEKLCNELMLDIQNTEFLDKNDIAFTVTTSVGILYIKKEQTDIDLITALDKTLYSSKEKGRNCCSLTVIE